MRVSAYAAPAAAEPLVPTEIERRDVGPNDVLIDIQLAGICHSDIHTVRGDWGDQSFPLVSGHEIVGTVTQGGYSTHVVVDADYVVSVPETLDLAAAAPLLCAGITTYSPLRRWNTGPGKKVAVVGRGGLGHMAVKIAHALGAEGHRLVAVPEEAGGRVAPWCRRVLRDSDPATFGELAGAFDLIVNTVSAPIDVDAYLGLLAVDGTIVTWAPPRSR